MYSKEELRKNYILIRNKIENKAEKSKIIVNKIKENYVYKLSKTIALYKSLPSEVDTTELINFSTENGKTVVLPKIINDEMRFYKIFPKEVLVKSKFGVEEPVDKEENFIEKNNIDLVIVPGICFDKEKNRIGFGKGYYDRFLANTSLKTIAICFEEQILKDELLNVDINDVKIQKIITDKNIY